jgi:hypothetical protein
MELDLSNQKIKCIIGECRTISFEFFSVAKRDSMEEEEDWS